MCSKQLFIIAGQTNNMNKRQIDNLESCNKKTIDEITKLANENQDWPIYNHPNGGIIKITPWGSIRQFELKGEVITKFEDMSFSDYDFTNLSLPYKTKSVDGNITSNILNSSDSSIMNLSSTWNSDQDTSYSSYELPCTPQSIKLSPGDEVEQYVLSGYNDMDYQYNNEQENYFGMMDDTNDN